MMLSSEKLTKVLINRVGGNPLMLGSSSQVERKEVPSDGDVHRELEKVKLPILMEMCIESWKKLSFLFLQVPPKWRYQKLGWKTCTYVLNWRANLATKKPSWLYTNLRRVHCYGQGIWIFYFYFELVIV